MKKNWIKYIILIGLFLSVCYFTGQSRKSQQVPVVGEQEPKHEQYVADATIIPTSIYENSVEKNDLVDANIQTSDENAYFTWEDLMKFEGNIFTEDNPWNTTAGYIQIEENNFIFLTPNTSVELLDVNCNENLEFSCEIYYAVQGVSDGVGLLIRVLDDENNIIHEEEIEVGNTDKKECCIMLSKYEKATKIRFLCNNGTEDNDNGDWLLIEIDEDNLSTSVTEKVDYVKAVHYFSDAWPINFWNSELDDLENEMQQIKNDGFNTIILVIPWKEFQTTTNPITYNEYPLKKLELIMNEAKRNDLYVMARIGYTWDFYNDDIENVLLDRYYAIMYDDGVEAAWMDYASVLYKTLKGYSNFLGGFMCWEDFWNNVYIAKAVTLENNVVIAEQMGYQAWVKENYTIAEINEIYDEEFEDYSSIYIPEETSDEFVLFFEFYDNFLNSLLVKTQQVFPNLSMEVRVDADLIYTNGEAEYYSHEKTYNCASSDFTTIVYGIPMGFENKGERVCATEAVEMTSRILTNVNTVTNNKALFIDQFLFIDNTPAFAHNAQVVENELDLYLEKVSNILVESSWGGRYLDL